MISILQVVVRVSNITAITKERTAIVVPNAIGIVTQDEKVRYIRFHIKTLSRFANGRNVIVYAHISASMQAF